MTTLSKSPSGHETRSAKTRTNLIEAAIDVIGSVGYEGASTRALAKAANTTLSAIPYHFGGKKELYLAAAAMIADYVASRFEEAVGVLDGEAHDEGALRLEAALMNILYIMVEDAEPHSWTSFVARCTYDNDDAFVIIYERALHPLLERLMKAAAEISGISWNDEALRLRISAILTAIVGLRFLRGLMLRSMGWTEMRAGSIEQIEAMVRDLCRSDFISGRRQQ